MTCVSPLDALVQASRCLAHPELVAAIDSALRRGVVRRDEVACIRPALDRALIDADPSAESGLESLTRLAIRDLGLHVEPQASIVGVGSVDLLVEGCVIVELDGATHRTSQQQRRDHDRDAVAMASGYTPLRFDYVQVIGRRELVARAVVNAVRTHRSVKSPGRVVRVAQMRLDATTRT
ncbi:endonuclease domain-containing protein [Pseudolysinimonas sp.]|uniref:endonuclease domain-containing protein n=1 Tax=Pseudolysinimonas sp. TaxID=2680009 RepID=UPI003F7F2503